MTPGRRHLRRARAARQADRGAGAAGSSRCGRCRRSCTTARRRFALPSTRPRTATTSSSHTRTAAPTSPATHGSTGAHCYEVYGAEHESATYFLTDFLVRSFDHVVWRGLGLDRYPELRDDYFRNYERVVWLAQEPTPSCARRPSSCCKLGLPLEVRETGDTGSKQALERLLEADAC